jgi:phosphoribosylformimino-5-aminoimidazole carboxamide ribonucleotide (ProFAR) isomerase
MVLLLTFPANGILNGSVQKMPRRTNAIKDVLTAIDNSIGSSGGITEVRINEQLKKSLYLLLVGSSSPYIRITNK